MVKPVLTKNAIIPLFSSYERSSKGEFQETILTSSRLTAIKNVSMTVEVAFLRHLNRN